MPLCVLNVRSKLYYEDEIMVILDCVSCKDPMVAYKRHEEPSQGEKIRMVAKARELFPERRLDFTRRTMPNHYYFHVR